METRPTRIGQDVVVFFFFNDPATTEIYTLPLHDALPICRAPARSRPGRRRTPAGPSPARACASFPTRDRKSTRLNSSHLVISYAVFCLKKKKKDNNYALSSQPDSRILLRCSIS